MNGFREFFENSPLFVIEESDNPFTSNKIRRATPKEMVESFLKEKKALEESGVEFSTIVIDSYNNIKKE